ncbi:MAG: 50S ribosomal protein L21 [Flavobacteriaceae bacterium]|nr:50S ribosomal protein L21 [Flavobacteriaceae bacterium]
MYAIVEIAGLQYKVEQDQKLFVNRLQADAGEEVTFDKVLLTDNGSVTVGAPVIKGVTVVAKVLDQVKGDKVIVFKKKRRKGYKVKNGHRQQFTQIQILSIGSGAETPKKAEKKAAPKKEKEVAKEEVKTEE